MDLELNRLTSVETLLDAELRLPDVSADVTEGALSDDGIRLDEPFRLVGSARRAGSIVIVTGRVTGRATLECGRCLEPMPFDIDVEFDSRFAEQPASPRGGPERRGEAAAVEEVDDGELTRLRPGAAVLSLVDVVRERVLLELPLRRVCSEACRGLCPSCGTNRNRVSCECPPEPEPPSGRLAALAELRRRLETS